MRDLNKMAEYAEEKMTVRRQLHASEILYLMELATANRDPNDLLKAINIAYNAGFTAGYRQRADYK